MTRLRKYMEKHGLWNEMREAALNKKVADQIEKALIEAESYPKSKPSDMFQHVYAEPTWMIQEQEQELPQPKGERGVTAWKRVVAFDQNVSSIDIYIPL